MVVWAIFPSIEGLLHPSSNGGTGLCLLPTLPAPAAQYDEQLFMAESNGSANVTFVVQAVPQTDSNGYGPAYLVNGLTSAGYWYQVGISYNWPCGPGNVLGFHFTSEVWGPGNHPVAVPIITPLLVETNNSVNLTLQFSGPNVVMSATDPTTGATQSFTYSAEGASSFVGGIEFHWFTGVMTEWYHAQAYYGGEQTVTYNATAPFSYNGNSEVMVGIDEETPSGGTLFYETDPVEITCACSYPFSYEGATVAVGPTTFTTGD